jgi:hypothetical protein
VILDIEASLAKAERLLAGGRGRFADLPGEELCPAKSF